jgi:hypothetical protein
MPEAPVWPNYLPSLDIGWKHSGDDNILRSTPERGPEKTRRKTTARVWTYSGTMTFTSSQYTRFLAFLHKEIADGALPFSWWDFSTGDWVQARITVSDTQQDADDQNKYTANVEIEVLP